MVPLYGFLERGHHRDEARSELNHRFDYPRGRTHWTLMSRPGDEKGALSVFSISKYTVVRRTGQRALSEKVVASFSRLNKQESGA